jgi:hypothetical protein
MTRTIGFLGVLVTIAIGAYLFAFQAKQENLAAQRPAAHAERQAAVALGSSNFQGAATQLEAYRAENGSYQGASLPPAFGVVVARATATSNCLQAGSGSTVEHEIGPGGSPQPGAC